MMRRMRMAIGCVVWFALGCGGGGGTGDDDPTIDAPPGAVDAPGGDAYVPPTGFTKLIGGSWTVPPGSNDRYHCARLTIANDTYVTNIVAEAPLGTHHTVLSISDGNTAGPDGEYACNVAELGMVMLYASGLGTSPLDFPTDVSVKIPAGTQIHLNLHLFNATDAPLSGTSAIHVKSQATPTPTLAEMVFAGTFRVLIPSNNQDTNIVGTCNNTRNFNLFAVWPHMHQLARHQKVELIRGMQTTVLHDDAYSFEEQTYFPQTPEVQVLSGDRIRVTCTYRNNTGQTVLWGESSNEEMCFTGLYRYPAAGADIFECSERF